MIHYKDKLFMAGHKHNTYTTLCGLIDEDDVTLDWGKVTCLDCTKLMPAMDSKMIFNAVYSAPIIKELDQFLEHGDEKIRGMQEDLSDQIKSTQMSSK